MKHLTDITDPTVVKALGHPLRRRILAALDGRVASPSELAAEFGEQIGTVSYHFRSLEKIGLVELVSTEPRRGALEHKYQARCVPYMPSEVYAALPEPVRRTVIHRWFTKISREVIAGLEGGGFDIPHGHAMRKGLTLPHSAAVELGRKIEELYHEALRMHDAAAEQITEEDPAEQVTIVMMLFGTDGSTPAKD
jgi:DNA-binding transcriptional ArsR family regulator